MVRDAHRHIGQTVELLAERRQLVVVGREQRPAAIGRVQMLDRGPGDRQPVESGRAAADLVEDHQAALRRLIEDRRRLHHLDHEGRTPPRQIVSRADARKQPVHDADMGGHAPAHRRRSAPARRSAHSAAGRSICPPCWGRSRAGSGRDSRPSGGESAASLAMKLWPSARTASSTTGCRPPADRERETPHRRRASRPAAAIRQLRKGRRDIEHRDRFGRGADRVALREDARSGAPRRPPARWRAPDRRRSRSWPPSRRVRPSRSASRPAWSGDGCRARSAARARKRSPSFCGTSTK